MNIYRDFITKQLTFLIRIIIFIKQIFNFKNMKDSVMQFIKTLKNKNFTIGAAIISVFGFLIKVFQTKIENHFKINLSFLDLNTITILAIVLILMYLLIFKKESKGDGEWLIIILCLFVTFYFIYKNLNPDTRTPYEKCIDDKRGNWFVGAREGFAFKACEGISKEVVKNIS
jgi:hypothetical protein